MNATEQNPYGFPGEEKGDRLLLTVHGPVTAGLLRDLLETIDSNVIGHTVYVETNEFGRWGVLLSPEAKEINRHG